MRESEYLLSVLVYDSYVHNIVPFGRPYKNLEKKDFQPMRKEYGENYELLKRKQVFPYRYLTGLKCMKEEGLILKEEFGSRLSNGEMFLRGEEKEVKAKTITDEDYSHYVKVMRTFALKTFGEYVSLYCASDTMLLGIIMKKFTETCMKDFGVDPTKSCTAPGFLWKAMLRMTGVNIELLTDREKYVFFEKSIRGGVAVVSNRYARANNPYMKDYEKEKPNSYTMEWDANSLYASVMVEKLPVSNFVWVGKRDLNYLERMLKEGKRLPPNKDVSLCVDLDYPEQFHERDNDYPLAPERVIINGVEKLAPNLGNKKEYYTTYEMLLYYLERGLVLKKVHSAISYKTDNFLKPYIEFCARKRKEAKQKGDKFGDDFWKLAGNGVYGKTFESVRNRCSTLFIGAEQREKLTRLFSKPNFISSTVLRNSNIVMVRMGKVSVKLDKTPFLGACILEKSKKVIYEFYDFVKESWPNSSLLFTDTDSLTFEVRTQDVYKEMIPHLGKRFDTSKYPKDHASGIPKGINASKIGGIFKDEMSGKPIIEFVGLAAKRYCIKTEEKCEKRNKGVPGGVVAEKSNFEQYYDCLKNAIYYSHYVKFASREHEITTELEKKEALSAYDHKRYLIPDDPFHRTLAWGHYRLPEKVKEQCDNSKNIKIVNTPLTF